MSIPLSPEKAALYRAAEILGGQAALAAAVGYEDRRNVWPWFKTGRRVPAEHCPAIERATREKGSPVLCEDLRPDVAWDVLRMQSGETCPDTGHRRRSTDPKPHAPA